MVGKLVNVPSGLAKYPAINGFAVEELEVKEWVKQVIAEKKWRSESDVVHNFAMGAPSEDTVTVMPVTQEKWQSLAFIDEVDFLGIALLFDNQAIPTLTKQKQIEL